MEHVRVYRQTGELLALLDNANHVSYSLKNNDLSTAKFLLPADDEKNEYCQAHNYVSIQDGARESWLFRVIGIPQGVGGIGGYVEYSLEHVIATLVDDVLFGYHEIGGTGVNTAAVIRYILSKQNVTRWQLGRCDFTDQFAYKFENANLLTALFSLGNVLADEYQWTYDTSTSPWTLNLVRLSASAPDCEIRYRRNMREIQKAMDATTLVTRLYMLGYGEGVNQLTIEKVNGGLPYIDADTQSTWGVKSSVCATAGSWV